MHETLGQINSVMPRELYDQPPVAWEKELSKLQQSFRCKGLCSSFYQALDSKGTETPWRRILSSNWAFPVHDIIRTKRKVPPPGKLYVLQLTLQTLHLNIKCQNLPGNTESILPFLTMPAMLARVSWSQITSLQTHLGPLN